MKLRYGVAGKLLGAMFERSALTEAVVKTLVAALLVLTIVRAASAQVAPAAKVDFRTAVQPLLKQHCISCHGPTQQMNGFRLDKRSAAMRGGSFPVIAPFNGAGSRFYLKLVGNQFGLQMPPTGKLPDPDIQILKAWIDQGAEWPDDLAGEGASKPPDPGATRLIAALRAGDTAAFARELAANRGSANATGPAGSTPLMYATLYGSADAMRDLLAAGADPNAAADGGTTALMMASHDPQKTGLLLEAGANPNARPDDGRTPLTIAANQFGTSAVVKLLLDKGANPTAVTASRTTALRLAAGTGDADLMRLLIEAGADLEGDAAAALTAALLLKCGACVDLVVGEVDQPSLGASLLVLSRAGDLDATRLLLDRGADVNTRGIDGRTPLMMAAISDAYPLEIVRTLIARGADVNVRTPAGETAASLAAVRGGAIVDALVKAGAIAAPPPDARPPTVRPGLTPRAAVLRSLPLLQKADATFLRKSGCVSCHNNSLTSMTVALARTHQFAVDESAVNSKVARLHQYMESWRESALRGVGIPGGQDTISYLLLGMAADHYEADAASDAMAHYLKARQLPDGHWRIQTNTNRPPIESSDIEVTATSMHAIQLYHPAPQRAEYDKAIRAAAAWLTTARAVSTEDRAFQLLGLSWAGGDKATITRLAKAFEKEQRPDGGWSPLATGKMRSDAYATGEALVALREAGVLAATAPAYARGVRFLLDTQLADGSWYVATRATPVQAYFESDFPYGRDQWISAAATNWATMALIPAVR
jgi:ankyrin repeat protein/mono/diheme cytochrome c family protein